MLSLTVVSCGMSTEMNRVTLPAPAIQNAFSATEWTHQVMQRDAPMIELHQNSLEEKTPGSLFGVDAGGPMRMFWCFIYGTLTPQCAQMQSMRTLSQVVEVCWCIRSN